MRFLLPKNWDVVSIVNEFVTYWVKTSLSILNSNLAQSWARSATTTSINFEAKLGVVVVAKLILVVVAKLKLVVVPKLILVVVAKLDINVVAKSGIVVVAKFGAELGPSYVIEKLPVLGMSGKF